ncbi:helix-turn-helix domain-containing protein [Undibacterium flavidum]|uniref:Helix-turn-helix transcriptional regulator n=1 Tax=Undibacterium flavidum TaxID=2762297 RepID=A0ABR6YBU1_9BURK|nr:helix-turn-helix domain-containing protein [Undibacterium flavidum]MBC3874037.1 helix-turn-helix transcriptional regulator [Undibacterium flavidum]
MPHIEYTVAQPDASLSRFVESYWMVVNRSEQGKDIVVMPDGRVDIHFRYSDDIPFHISLAGLEQQAFYTAIPAHSVMFAVSFRLAAVEYLLNTSIAPILNSRGQLPDDFWEMSKSDLEDFPRFCQKLNDKLIDKLSQLVSAQRMSAKLDARKLAMFDLIYASKGSASVKQIAEAANWSSRQINRYFNEWFGLSLKTYCTILKFRSSFQHIKEGKLFPESEFSDQSHFIKTIKKYSGHTPKELFKNEDDRFVQLSERD